jgi:hypothetical protein
MPILFTEPIYLGRWDIAPLFYLGSIICIAQLFYMFIINIIFPIIVYAIVLPLEYFNKIPKGKYHPKLNNDIIAKDGEIDDKFVMFFFVDILNKIKFFFKIYKNN